jgi:aryl-alcohol dehydrogenase-like predicted oxidoreductase
MEYRPLGKSGIDASVIGFGAWAIGGWMWGGTSESDAIAAVHAAIESGINLIDTAPVYGFGTSEEIVGKAITDRRDSVVLATKCGMVWHTDKGDHAFDSDEQRIRNGADERHVYKYLGPESIRYEVEQSLRRLGVETIDLYQTHWQESTTPREDTMAVLLKLKEEGKIRAIGVSNITPKQLDEYRKVGTVDSDQELFSMLDRDREKDLLPYCERESIAFLAYSPLAQGLLTGKVGPDRDFSEGDQRKTKPRFSTENRRKVQAMLEEIKPIAEQHNVTLAQLALAWTYHQPGCSHVLAGARNPQQAEENAAAGDLLLSKEESDKISRAIDRHAVDIP